MNRLNKEASNIRKILLDDIKNNIRKIFAKHKFSSYNRNNEVLPDDLIERILDESIKSKPSHYGSERSVEPALIRKYEDELILLNINFEKIINFIKRNPNITLESPKNLVEQNLEWHYPDIPEDEISNKKIRPIFMLIGDILSHQKQLKEVLGEIERIKKVDLPSHPDSWLVDEMVYSHYLIDERSSELLNDFLNKLTLKEYKSIKNMIIRKRSSLYAKGTSKNKKKKKKKTTHKKKRTRRV